MTLAFYPLGAFLAGLVLGAVFTLFAVGLRVLDRAATRAESSILPGMVAGFRDWSNGRRASRVILPRPRADGGSAASDPASDEVTDQVPQIFDLP